jgi:hypothetical protein
MNDLIRSSVLYYVANDIQVKKEVDTSLREDLPTCEEVVNTFTEIAGKSQSKTWRGMFFDSSKVDVNEERLLEVAIAFLLV